MLTPAIGAVALLAAAPPAGADSTLAQLVDAAAQRLQVADDVAAAKWHSGAAIEDPARVQQQLIALATAAVDAQLDPDYVTRIFTDQIGATEAAEHYRFAQWKLDLATAPVAAPDLAASRARIDGLNHAMLTELGARRRELHAPDCAARLDEAIGEVAGARRLDAFYRQALAAATRDYCA